MPHETCGACADADGAIGSARAAARTRARHPDQGRRNTVRFSWRGYARRSRACGGPRAASPGRTRATDEHGSTRPGTNTDKHGLRKDEYTDAAADGCDTESGG